MFPPPITMPTSTPISTSSRTSWAICCNVRGEMPYLPSPISASPLSLRRIRLKRGGLCEGTVTGRGSYLAPQRRSRRASRNACQVSRKRVRPSVDVDGDADVNVCTRLPPASVCVVEALLARRAREARQDLDLRERVELDVDGAGLELFEAARGGEEPGIERSDGAVVGLERALQRAAELGEVLAQVGDALVQLAAFARDLARVDGHRVLLPDVGDGEQQGEQGGRRGEHDAPR